MTFDLVHSVSKTFGHTLYTTAFSLDSELLRYFSDHVKDEHVNKQ